MSSEEKILKWLAGELSDVERKEFEGTDEFADIARLLKALENFKAPEYDVNGQYKRVSENVVQRAKTISIYKRIGPALRIAAIFIVALTIGYFTYNQLNSDLTKQEWISAQDEVVLPDSSLVLLNADSKIRFSHKKWETERNVELMGEAFFKVRTGSQFVVKSPQGTVKVLGTEFGVKDWNNYYEVTCYSGMVEVITDHNFFDLEANTSFRILHEKEEHYTLSAKSGPDWLNGESSFSSVPLYLVMNELERQYQVKVVSNNFELDQLFTGSFTHNNLRLAMESITIPVDLNFEIQDDKIVIILESE